MRDARRLDLSRWLLDAGAGASARAVLGAVRGPEANQVRARAAAASLRAGFYGLGLTPEGHGLVVPLRATPGASRAADGAFHDASERAMRVVREALAAPGLPAMHLDLEDALGSFGESLGLGAALAFAAHCAGRAPERPVLVTGALRDDGGVAPVEGVPEKVSAALRENARPAALVLVPAGCAQHGRDARVSPVGTLREALALALGLSGGERLSARADLVALDALFERARALRDPDAALALLQSVPAERASAADRARLFLEMGMHQRHAGRTELAARLHAEGVALLEQSRRVLGASLAETYELQAWSTRLDQFEIDAAIAALAERLARPFVQLHNEVRCRGVLAQALSTAGRVREAIDVRAQNLALQAESDALRRELPWTYCVLASDAARAGFAAEFDAWAERLCALTPPGEAAQWRYNALALARGLVSLGRAGEAVAWLRGDRALHGAFAPRGAVEVLLGDGAVSGYPEVSLARAACRALRREGDARGALSLADRVRQEPAGGADLLAWIAGLAEFEGALALAALGRGDEARARAEAAREKLGTLHPAASGYHRALFACDATDEGALESALDAVWY